MPVWPVDLPQKPLASAYSAEDGESVLRTSMDAGPDKTRQRFTAVPDFLTCVFKLSPAQYTTFMGFYRETIARGALPFDWQHPETDQAVSCRIVGKVRRSQPKPPNWRVEMTIEVLP